MKLFYRKYGNGPPLIILHGLYGSSDNWTTIAKILGDTFTVYLPDQRNHGQSLHSDTHDYDSMRDDLFETAVDLKLNKFFLAGHSMGGKSAISFALKWPEMLYGLMIADISPFINENLKHSAYNQHLTILTAILSVDLSKIRTRKEVESILKENIHSEKIRGFILKNLQRGAGNNFTWKINASALLKNLEKIMEGIDRPANLNQQITGFPVVFLRGENSDYLPASDFNDILKVFPAAELVNVANAGHWIHAERPDEVIRNILELLRGS
ncbi:MAG TPA: alpha/beta fold hydrolase [Bacteroidales bacterium]|nr:alpha/beta fold hydrolase [Bacteroidales bacterium]